MTVGTSIKVTQRRVIVITDSADFTDQVRKLLSQEEFEIEAITPNQLTDHEHYDYHVIDACRHNNLTPRGAVYRRLRCNLKAHKGMVVGGPIPQDPRLGKIRVPSLAQRDLIKIFSDLDELAGKAGTLAPRESRF